MKIMVIGSCSSIAKEYATHRRFKGDLVSNVNRTCSVDDYESNQWCDSLITFSGSVNNAKLVEMVGEQWDMVIEDTLSYVARSLAGGLIRMKDGGSVVIVGSIVGSTGGYGCANYAAAKAGLVGLVRAAANEMLERNIRVNLLELGYVEAGMGERLDDKVKQSIIKSIPMKRFAHVNEVIKAIDFLANDATYMTGGILQFAGGLR